MSEMEQQPNPEQNESQRLDLQLRHMASELGFVETPKIQTMLEPAPEGADVRQIIDEYENELEIIREDNPNADFLAAAALIEAAMHIKEAYNNLADAVDILTGEKTHPETLVQIEAMRAKL